MKLNDLLTYWLLSILIAHAIAGAFIGGWLVIFLFNKYLGA